MQTLQYLDPSSPNVERKLYVPAVSELRGKRIAFLNNGWASYTFIGERMEEALRARFGTEVMKTYPIPTSCAPPPGLLDTVVAEADAAVVGMAN
ncbi:MAG: hypothetical protein IT531_20600 [Burkholderiales bacterium]|nr:hypothetical protein [Burkholderiales bacterium]